MKKIIIILIALSTFVISCRTPKSEPTTIDSNNNDTSISQTEDFIERPRLQMKGAPIALKLDGIDTLFPDYDCLEVSYRIIIRLKCNESNYSNIRLPNISFKDDPYNGVGIRGWNKIWVFEEWGSWVLKDDPYEVSPEDMSRMGIKPLCTGQDTTHTELLDRISRGIEKELRKRIFFYDETDWNRFKKRLNNVERIEVIEGDIRLR